jgi:lysophospholipase L1-like esterase
VSKSPDTITVVFMGDSITEGQYVDPPHRWVDIVSTEMTRHYETGPFAVSCLVRGISGETSRQGLERFPKDVQAYFPDVVTLQFGLNDCNCWDTDRGLPRVSEAAYRANLVEMVDRCRRFGAERIILSNNHVTLRHTKLSNERTLEEQRARYNKVVADVANETGVTFCDIESEFVGLSRRELERELLEPPDLLHLSHDGHRRYASKIKPYVAAAIEAVMRGRVIATSTERTND